VMAVGIYEKRLSPGYENPERLGMKTGGKQGEGRLPEQWGGKEEVDRIFLGAPRSPTRGFCRPPGFKRLGRGCLFYT
ncbi:16S rRNA (cytosine(967)-C(5))-methyltransferase, partial [Klebsiella pneumoniae]|nr:16S rRNA (cytosine(967)-C(5))-methyltransferase [Klebsiella pneumoniae]